MRRLVCIFFCVLLAACGQQNPLAVGLDTSLYVEDTVSRAELQDRYFGYMCLRAGLFAGSPANPACPPMTKRDWQSVVLAALNDIDDRCELYLSSLDNAKRDRVAYLAQLGNLKSTTALILTATGLPAAEVGARALEIVELAFGLAENSLENYYSRLILAVEGGTIQQLVLKRQTAYRMLLKTDYLKLIENKPSAYYAIRGYLRICLPASIEGAIASSIDDLSYWDFSSGDTDAASSVRKGYSRKTQQQMRREAGSGVYTRDDPDLEALRAIRR